MDKSILLVDDEPDILTALGSRLKKVGYNVTCVDTGKKATSAFIESYYDAPFDIVLLDIGLPDISGVDVLKTIRLEEEIRGLKYDNGVKIIVQTGRKESWMETFNLGCDDFIVKPYSFEDFLNKIKEKLGET